MQIKLSIQRLRTLQEKKLALAKKARRDIADLVAKSRIETAKLRVEGLIQDDIYVELLELLEVGRAIRTGRRAQTRESACTVAGEQSTTTTTCTPHFPAASCSSS